MADLLPSTPDTSAVEENEPRVVGLDDDEAGDLLAALSSETARNVLGALHDEPDTPSGVADRVDTSLQNAQYHLDRMADAGAIEVIDTVYSEKGREMNVYGPADRPLVVFAGADEEKEGLVATLRNLIGGVAGLGVLSAVIEWALRDGPWLSFLGNTGASRAPQATSSPGTYDVAASGGAETAATAASAGPPPGLLFFLGGLVVLVAALAVHRR